MPVTVTKNKFPLDTPRDGLEREVELRLRHGALSCRIEEEADTNVDFADKLEAAGGNADATSKSATFVAAWKELARDPDFGGAQHSFIKATHYDPFIEQVRERLEFDINTRPLALRNVAWSTAVQHGPANKVFENALAAHRLVSALSDKDIINAVYDERSKVDTYFRKSTPKVKQSVKDRFVRERAKALQMLEA